MPRRYHAYPDEFQVLNVLSTARRDRCSAWATLLPVVYLI